MSVLKKEKEISLVRPEENFREIEEIYHSLYGASASTTSFFEGIMKRLRERSAELKARDLEREGDKDWFLSRKAVGMTMYTELFNGTFCGLERKIPYLKELGITYLHLMPVMKMPAVDNDGGYAVDDYLKMDEKFGSNANFISLVKALHRSGISICLDFVMNHTSSTHEWAEKAKSGDARYIAFYQTYPDRKEPDEFEKTVPEVFPSTAPGNFIWCEEMKRWVMSSFYPYQWDLDYHNPAVLEAMVFNILDLANMGVDVFRLDAVPYIWKEKGTTCRNLPEVHRILRIVRLALDSISPGVVIKGEVVMAPRELAAYFGSQEKTECQLLYDVPVMVNIWSSLAMRDARLIMAQAEKIFSLPPHCNFVNYVRCHDDIGWGLDEDDERRNMIDPLLHKEFLYRFYDGEWPGTYARGELYNYDPVTKDARSCGTTSSLCGLECASNGREMDYAVRRYRLVYATVWAMRGFPMINSGDEIGQLNDYSYRNDVKRADDSRNVHRSRFDWEKCEKRNVEGTTENTLWSILRTLQEKRASSAAFDPDAYVSTWQSGNNHVFSIRRTKGECDMLLLSSFSEEQEHVRFEYFFGEYRDVFSGKVVTPGLGFSIEPLSVMWIERITK